MGHFAKSVTSLYGTTENGGGTGGGVIFRLTVPRRCLAAAGG